MAKTKSQPIHNASEVIERFGGIRPMAAKIDTPVTTVQGWKKRDVIPGTRRDQIMAAAQDNNIDLSNVATAPSAASQAATSGTKKATKKSASKATKAKATPKATKTAQSNTAKTAASASAKVSQSASKRTTNEDEVKASPSASKTTTSVPSVSSDADTKSSSDKSQSHDDILNKIEKGNRKALISSIWITVALVLLGLALAAFLLWPLIKNDVHQQNPALVQKIEQLETKVNIVEERTSFFGNVIPDNLVEQIDGLKEQAQSIQTTVSDLSNQAGDISRDVLGADAGPLSNRLAALEKKVTLLSNSKNFNALIGRVKGLEESLAGQEQLKNSVSELQNLMLGVNGAQDGNLAANLRDVQNQNNGALGQTLQGVSGNDLKAAAMLLAFSKFRDSLNREESFEEDLMLLQKLAGEDNTELQTAINRLAPKARTGVLTPAGLSNELRSATGEIVFSSLKGEDVSIKEKTVARLNNVFQVEKEGEPVLGTDTQITVARAQKLLDEGKVGEAVAQLQTLEGHAAQTAQPIVNQAQATLLAERVQEIISNSILSKVADVDLKQVPLPSNIGGFDTNAIKENIEKVLPEISANDGLVKDEESGFSILPSSPSFKGFSGGQTNYE